MQSISKKISVFFLIFLACSVCVFGGVTVSGPGTGTLFRPGVVTITWGRTENISDVTLDLYKDNVFQNRASFDPVSVYYTYNLSADGNYMIKCQITNYPDNVQNPPGTTVEPVYQTYTNYFTIDGTVSMASNLAITGAAGIAYQNIWAYRPYADGSVRISWSGIGDADRNGYLVNWQSYNGGAWGADGNSGWLGAGVTSYSRAVPDGKHRVRIIARDNIDNVSYTAWLEFVTDGTRPVLSITSNAQPGAVLNKLDMTIQARDDAGSAYPGCINGSTFNYTLQCNGADVFNGVQNLADKAVGTGYDAALSYSRPGVSGVYTWNFNVSDKPGNAAQVLTLSRTLLLDEPQISGFPAAADSGWFTASHFFTIRAADAMGVLHASRPDYVQLYYSTDGKEKTDAEKTWIQAAPLDGDWNPYEFIEDEEGDYIAVPFDEGKHTVDVRVVDAAGNISDERKEFNVDTAAPALAMTINNKSLSWSAEEIYYINADTDVSVIRISDATSGVLRLVCERDAGSASAYVYPDLYVLPQNGAAAVTAAEAGFAPVDGSHTYTFTLTDAAGNITVLTTRLVKDAAPVAVNDISFELIDENSTASAEAAVSASGLPGNFSNLKLVVKDQGTGSAQVKTYTWRLNGAEQMCGDFPANAPFSAVLIPGLIAEGEYTVDVTVTDEAENTTAAEQFRFSVDRTAPAISKQWVAITDDGGASGTFTVNPADEDSNIRVYQTGADFATAGAGSVKIWDNGTVTDTGGNMAAGSFTLSGGTGTVYLAAIDPAGNRQQAAYTIVRPAAPPAPDVAKVVSSDYASFAVKVMSAAPAVVLSGVAYEWVYLGVGADAAGNSGEVAPQAAVGTPFQWGIDSLRSIKACSSGQLGFIKAWAVLIPCGAANSTTIALKSFGSAVVYDIPDSPPQFRETVTWPEYLGKNSAVSWPVAADPDGHTVWYRIKTVSWSVIWTSGGSQGAPPGDGWSAHLAEGGSVYLQAWAGEESAPDWLSAGITEVSHTYDAADIDFLEPTVSTGGIWGTRAAWTKAASFSLAAEDPGASGLGSVVILLTPCNEDGSEDLTPGRCKVESVLGGFTAGAATADFTVALPESLAGLYRLTVTATDRAGNQTVLPENLARFDYVNPNAGSVVVTRPYDSANARYYADALGTLTVLLGAEDLESGLNEWGIQVEGGDWEWNSWMGASVIITPDWSLEENLRVRFAVRDKAGNESTASSWNQVSYDKRPPEFTLMVTGMTGSGPGYVRSLETLSASVSPAGLNTEWSVVEQQSDGTGSVCGGKAAWNEVQQEAGLWVDGGQYRIRAKVTNRSGIAGIKESAFFILDRTKPAAVRVELAVPAESGRTTYYRNEPLQVTWSGGADAESPVRRVIRLYQMVGGERKELNSVTPGSGEMRMQITWGTTDIEWESGGFFIEGRAVNGAGDAVTSVPVPVPAGGEGLVVHLPPYNSGTGEVALSWSAGRIPGVVVYSYQFWRKGAADTPLGGEVETALDGVLADLTTYGLADGERIYAAVRAYSETGALAAMGTSTVSEVDSGVPVIEWTAVPQAVTGKRVWSRFRASGTVSGIAAAKWLIEKKGAGAEWVVVPCGETDWRPAADGNGCELAADLRGQAATGDLVRLTVFVENAVGRAAQAVTGALPVDDTPPPVPVVVDQGMVINHTKQVLSFNWQLTAKDSDSGPGAWFYGWFYRGEAVEPAVWNKLAGDELRAAVDLRSAAGDGLDGKTVVLAVKSVNQAGLATVGYSDGILLDSTAPLIYGINVYADSSKSVELTGYVRSSAVIGKSVYLEIQAMDGQSWVDGGEVYAGRWDEEQGAWIAVGGASVFTDKAVMFFLPGDSAGFTAGSRWRFESVAEDAAGNISGRAASAGFLVEGVIPYVTNVQCAIDAACLNLTWDLNAGSRWVSYYMVTAQWGSGSRLFQASTRTASFVWGAGGLELKSGDTVQFTVSAFSYTGDTQHSAVTDDYQVSAAIDAAPPVLDEAQTAVPLVKGAGCWYDRLEGHLVYTAGRGVSSLQWSAVLVPGELPLVGWQEKRWAAQWDFEKHFSAITADALSGWHGKRIRLKFRAANTMGIWSGAAMTAAITVDTTDPGTVLERVGEYSNETGEVAGWTLRLEDKQSGILEYMTLLVPASEVTGDGMAAAYTWPENTEVHAVFDTSPAAAATVNTAIALSAGREGSYIPLVRVRNGTGHWSVTAGKAVMIDRTSPVADVMWPGAVVEAMVRDGKPEILQVSNGPVQDVMITTDEPVKCVITGTWFTALALPGAGYTDSVTATLDFGINPDGRLYPVTIELEDQAGNYAAAVVILRYNRAPVIRVNREALTVRPGAAVCLEELISIADEEENRAGDYPLKFQWLPGNGSMEQNWTGG